MVAKASDERNANESPDQLREWVDQTLAGDRAAARALFVAVGPIFLAAARRTLGRDHPDVDDFVQEASLRFFGSLAAFRGESRVRRYAYRVGVHVAADWVRRRSALKRDRIGGEIPEHAASDGSTAEPARRQELLGLLASWLSPVQLETFLYRTIMGCTLDEVGDLTGVSPNTVRSRMRLARNTIQRELARRPEWQSLVENEHD